MAYGICPVGVSMGPTSIAWMVANLEGLGAINIIESGTTAIIFTLAIAPGIYFRYSKGSFMYGLTYGTGYNLGLATLTDPIDIVETANSTPVGCIVVATPTVFAIVETFATEARIAVIARLSDDSILAAGLASVSVVATVKCLKIPEATPVKAISLGEVLFNVTGFYFTSDYFFRDGASLLGTLIGVKNLHMNRFVMPQFYLVSGNDIIIPGGTGSTDSKMLNNILIPGGAV